MIYKSFNQQVVRPLTYLTIAVLVGTLIVVLYYTFTNNFEMRHVPRDERMSVTPMQIKSVQDVRIWEFLSIDDEELVSKTKKHLLKDAHLTRIYYGKVRYGVDLARADSNWVQMIGDTVDVKLPPIQLLDERFIDEARTETFFESGSWSHAEKEALYTEAQKQMRTRCVTKENEDTAKRNALQQFEKIFTAMGFMYVHVHF